MTPIEIQQIVETAIEHKMMFPWWAYALWALISFVSCFIAIYLKEKGKNLATKEDISEITNKIEAAKLDYSSKLESVKTALGSKLFITQVRYQNEFDLLVSLSKKLATLRDALSNFETHILLNQASATSHNSANEKVEELFAAMQALYKEYEGLKPFYPEDIYQGLQKLHAQSWTKLVLKADEENLIEKGPNYKLFIDTVKDRSNNSATEGVGEIIDNIHDSIRKRVMYWEQFSTDNKRVD